jgi:hypothetical protein
MNVTVIVSLVLDGMFHVNILSRVGVTIDGVCIGNRIDRTLQHTTVDYTLQITITQKLVFIVAVFTSLLGNFFQQWTFLGSRVGGHLTPTSYSSNCCLSRIVRVTLRLEVYSQSVFFQLYICGYSPYVTPSLRRGWVCRLQLLLDLASAVVLGSESRRTHILLCQTRDSHNLEGQVPVFISPKNRVVQLYPQALDSLFVASYDS